LGLMGLLIQIFSLLSFFPGVPNSAKFRTPTKETSGHSKNGQAEVLLVYYRVFTGFLLVDVLPILGHPGEITIEINCSQLTKTLKSKKYVLYCYQKSEEGK